MRRERGRKDGERRELRDETGGEVGQCWPVVCHFVCTQIMVKRQSWVCRPQHY